jgi:hypothetical protein
VVAEDQNRTEDPAAAAGQHAAPMQFVDRVSIQTRRQFGEVDRLMQTRLTFTVAEHLKLMTAAVLKRSADRFETHAPTLAMAVADRNC